MKIKTIELDDWEAGLFVGIAIFGAVFFLAGLLVGHFIK